MKTKYPCEIKTLSDEELLNSHKKLMEFLKSKF